MGWNRALMPSLTGRRPDGFGDSDVFDDDAFDQGDGGASFSRGPVVARRRAFCLGLSRAHREPRRRNRPAAPQALAHHRRHWPGSGRAWSRSRRRTADACAGPELRIHQRHAAQHALRYHGRDLPDGDRQRRAFRCRYSSLFARQPAPICPAQLRFFAMPKDHTEKRARNDVKGGCPSREEAEEAVRVLIRWAGDDPDREGLKSTPGRVVRAYEEHFAGYGTDPADVLGRTFKETNGYDEIVVLKDIRFESHCEHHIAPIIGRVHVAYLPDKRVIGISKLAR